MLKESVRIIRDKLDIFNIFRDLYFIEHSKSNNINKNLDIIKMSNESSRELSILRANQAK